LSGKILPKMTNPIHAISQLANRREASKQYQNQGKAAPYGFAFPITWDVSFRAFFMVKKPAID